MQTLKENLADLGNVVLEGVGLGLVWAGLFLAAWAVASVLGL